METKDAVPFEEETSLVKASPVSPVSLNQLAALSAGEGVEIMKARISILNQMRRASIMMTSPEDWLTFKRPDGRETAYLSDSGCERIRDLWGIEITPTSDPTRLPLDSGNFMYVIRGDGISHVTGKTVKDLEGGRGSDEKFCESKKGALLELAVRKAARANLDGGIVRELTGLSNVPREELEEVWRGTSKRYEHCSQGRGYGSRERRTEQAGFTQDTPSCPICGSTMTLKKGKTGQFWGCTTYPKCKGTRKHDTSHSAAPPPPEGSEPPPDPEESTGTPSNQESEATGNPLLDAKNLLLAQCHKFPPSVSASFRLSIMKATDINQLLDVETNMKERK
jgi:ribosomal protein L37AE/L43A